MSNIEAFVEQVNQAFNDQDEHLFSQLITTDITDPAVDSLLTDLNHTSEDQVEKIVDQALEDTSFSLAEAMKNYLEVLRCSSDTDLVHVFETFANFYSSLIPLFNGSEAFYQLPVIKDLSSQIVCLASLVDKSTGLKRKAQKANTAARLVSKMFNIMLADRSPMETSKRQGIFHITNLAFKLYFKLNNVRMCQTMISNIRTGGVDLDEFPISEQVTYKYYLGRYSLFHGRLKLAQECLLFAFQKCHKDHWHNKRLILHYLIPTRIILGHFPSRHLLEYYQLTGPYLNLIETIRTGNILGFMNHLETHFTYFYKHYTYVLLKEKALVILWRCLIRNMYIQKQKLGTTVPILHFGDCFKAFRYSSKSDYYQPRDIECILVSLVSQGYIRGYLQHQKQRVILSKVNAFPPISSVKLHIERYNEKLMEDHLNNAQPPLDPAIEEYLK